MEHLVIGIGTTTLYAVAAVLVAVIIYLVRKNAGTPG